MEGQEVKKLEDCTVAKSVSCFVFWVFHFMHMVFKLSKRIGTWVFSVAGAVLAIPIGIKRKSLGPLVFFGTTSTMLDIIMGITQCEREHAECQAKLLEAQNPTINASSETGAETSYFSDLGAESSSFSETGTKSST